MRFRLFGPAVTGLRAACKVSLLAPSDPPSAMKDLRALLIDARIELRKSQRDFMKSELCDRMNQAISDLGNLPAGTNAPTGAAATPEPAPIPMAPSANRAHTANQVGLAWQTAA